MNYDPSDGNDTTVIMQAYIKSDRLQWHAQTLSNLLRIVNGLVVLWLIAQLADRVISLLLTYPPGVCGAALTYRCTSTLDRVISSPRCHGESLPVERTVRTVTFGSRSSPGKFISRLGNKFPGY